MKVVFRSDASLQIGTGHVMRCLTLADALKAQGAKCHFISREHPGHLFDLIRQRGFEVNCLPTPVRQTQAAFKIIDVSRQSTEIVPAHAEWLGCDWQTDAVQTAAILAAIQPDWLVTDHYALAQPWEAALKPHYKKLMVIDDLADRAHVCDLLLDQNWFGDCTTKRYSGLVPPHCTCDLGPEYALLKPEYADLRAAMAPRDGAVRRVLVFLGGSDPTNQTGRVLAALTQPGLAHLLVDVVIGQNHPDAAGVAGQAAVRPGTTLHQHVPTLASLMVNADLMIGGGGATTWERMCLGLPAIVISVAANQTITNVALMNAGYILFLGEVSAVSFENIVDAVQLCLENPATLKAQSSFGQKLVPGIGAQIVGKQLLGNAGIQDAS